MRKTVIECEFDGCDRVAVVDYHDDTPEGWRGDFCPRHTNPYRKWTPPSPAIRMLQDIYKDIIVDQLAPKNQILIIHPEVLDKMDKTVTFPIVRNNEHDL